MSTILKVVYVSQKDRATAGYSINDCGPACISMMAKTIGVDVSPDQVYRDAKITTRGPLAVNTIKYAGNLYNLNLGRHDNSNGMGLTRLKEFLDGGRPALVLVSYFPVMRAGLNESSINGGHFVVAVGYDDNYIHLHDPYWDGTGGAFRKWPIPVWNEAWYQYNTQYQRICLVPNSRIAEPKDPPYPVPADIRRRMRAKAMWEGQPTPVPASEADYNDMLAWLGDWGTQTADYVVESGDTLGAVSEHFYGGADYYMAIAAFNDLANPNQIEVGQKLRIPLPPGTAIPSPIDPEKPVVEHPFTNQQVINAFHTVFSKRGEAHLFWEYATAAGLAYIADSRSARYSGPPILALQGVPKDALAEINKLLTGA